MCASRVSRAAAALASAIQLVSGGATSTRGPNTSQSDAAGTRRAAVHSSAGFATSAVEWPAFLLRHDLSWEWSADPASWPSSWASAAWLGNGLHGISPMIDPWTGNLRFEIGRADVYSCGYDPRLPIGYLSLRTAGKEGEV